ncbi:DNA-binding response regulator [Galactobacter valiniphilus]|uniref:DNA-binding response regulator n=1 Tax=Galactobacter valiniphilus TaxID=2676122 RepID=A0A399JCC5_9MICC|nr:response regulator transcription factor [Galactobacter valiniphilus]RII42730.1 DNA-binding response regulator [Galactobacter valiniphilus]
MTESSPIRVALVDDQTLVRSGFRMLIDSQPDLEVVAEVASGREAVQSPAVSHADVVLMDIRMPEMDGIEATQRILSAPASQGHPRVLILTTFDLDEYALDAVKAGASGFLLKDAPPEELLGAIRTVFHGGGVVAPTTTRRLLDHMAPLLRRTSTGSPEALARVNSLTAREREVFEHIAAGRSNTEIASDLFLSEATVKTHMGRILAKLEARDRVQAVLIAYETGVVTP